MLGATMKQQPDEPRPYWLREGENGEDVLWKILKRTADYLSNVHRRCGRRNYICQCESNEERDQVVVFRRAKQ